MELEDHPQIEWREEPVPLTTFITDRAYLGNPPLSDIQYEAVRHAERIYFPWTYTQLALSEDPLVSAYWNQPCRMVNFLTLQWGKGSGKDHICRMVSLRIVYLLFCLPSPQEYFGMPEQDTIHLLNVASSSQQASRAFFTPMTRVVRRGWFAGRCDPKQNVIEYPAINTEQISGHSDAESQEGLNLLLGVADEIDAFKSQEELDKSRGIRARESTRSAEGILGMIRSSASTRFPVTYKIVRISYPRYLGSTIQVLTNDARKDNEAHGATSRHFVDGPKATWEVNPRVQQPCGRHLAYQAGCQGCWDASKAVFREDYEEDPLFAAAKYECRPSRAINPYFSNEIAVDSCMHEGPEPLGVDYVRDGQAWRPVYAYDPSLIPIQGAQYAMHADLAVRGDRAGVALAHVKRWEEVTVVGHDETGTEVPVSEQRPVVKVDFVISYSADSSAQPPREIQIRWARDLCLELRRRGFNIRRFTADGYQSTDTLQILELQQGMETDTISTDRDEGLWRSLRDLFNEGRIEMARRELVRTELLGLSKMPNGKVDHMPGSSKDEADALAGAVDGALQLGGREDADEHGRAQQAYLGDLGPLEPEPLPLPIGFVDPALFSPAAPMDHLVPLELDGMGRPVFSGVFDFGEVESHQG
jgi:hypothetical protein